MEAERNSPPMIKAAFTRNTKARKGWELMPQSLRRQYLIGILRSRFPETRALYLERIVMESAQYADRACGRPSVKHSSENPCNQCYPW